MRRPLTSQRILIDLTLSFLLVYAQVLEGAWCGRFRQWLAVLELFQNDLNGLVELLVDTLVFKQRVIVDDDVGIDTVILYNPVAVSVIVGEEGHSDVGAIHVRQ